ncbi:MAG: hypothetical protein CfClM3_0089 [Methanobrevibacter sp. CfCl-M3]
MYNLKSSINFEDLIMELFNSEEDLVLSVSEIARRIGHPNSDERGTNYHNYPVHNAVNSLVKKHYLCKDSDGSKTQVYLPTTNTPPLPISYSHNSSKYAVYALTIDNQVYYGISMYISKVQLIDRVNMWLDDSKDEHIYNYEVINAYNKFGSCVLEIKEIVQIKQ